MSSGGCFFPLPLEELAVNNPPELIDIFPGDGVIELDPVVHTTAYVEATAVDIDEDDELRFSFRLPDGPVAILEQLVDPENNSVTVSTELLYSEHADNDGDVLELSVTDLQADVETTWEIVVEGQ